MWLPEQSLDIPFGQKHSSAFSLWVLWAESSLYLLPAAPSLQPASRAPAYKTKIAQLDKRPWGWFCSFAKELLTWQKDSLYSSFCSSSHLV